MISFLREKPARLLLAIKDGNSSWHLSKIAKSASVTYVFVTNYVHKLEHAGIVTVEVRGKKRVAVLTEKGAQLANLVDEIRKKLEQPPVRPETA